MKIVREKGIIAGHGADRTDFTSFDVSRAAPYNVGLHFGTRAAALDRLAYLAREWVPSTSVGGDLRAPRFRLLKCRLDIRNPFRVDDVFGFSYIGILTALEDEIVSRESADRAASMRPPLRSKIAALINREMRADDNPRMVDDAYRAAYCAKMNADIIRLFRSLGYDGLVKANAA